MSSAVYHDGHLLRSIPASFLSETPTGVSIERRTVLPPYWHADNQTMAVPPFEAVDQDMLTDAVAELIRYE